MEIFDIDGASIEVVTEGDGPHLILLPTLLAELTVYDDVVGELARYRTVHRVNFPGFGRSTGPIGPAIEDYADMIALVMRRLRLPLQTDVLGNGFGGFVAGSLAIRHGHMFNRLVLVDTGPGFPEDAKDALRTLARKALSEGMPAVLDAAVKRMFPDEFMSRNPHVIDTRKAQLAQANPGLFANAALALTKLDNAPLLGQIRNATLVIVGTEDQTTPPALSVDLKNGIRNAAFIELPGIGHCPQLQDPVAFLSAIRSFLGFEIQHFDTQFFQPVSGE